MTLLKFVWWAKSEKKLATYGRRTMRDHNTDNSALEPKAEVHFKYKM